MNTEGPENFPVPGTDGMTDTSPFPAVSPSVEIDQDQVLSDPITFYEAMQVVLRGGAIRRLSWLGPVIIVKIVDNKLMILCDDNLYHPLIISVSDLLGEDWVRVSEE